jgi:hypothetical protein
MNATDVKNISREALSSGIELRCNIRTYQETKLFPVQRKESFVGCNCKILNRRQSRKQSIQKWNEGVHPYLPSRKKFWFETFDFNKLSINNKQSSTTIPNNINTLFKPCLTIQLSCGKNGASLWGEGNQIISQTDLHHCILLLQWFQ